MDSNDIIALISAVRGRTYRFIQRELDSRGMKGLAPSHGAILSALFCHDEIAMGDVAAMINRDRSTVTTLVRKLVKHGYVKRRKDPMDSRMVYISLTPAGRGLEADFREISRALLARTYRGFRKSEKKVLVHYLEKMQKNWENE